MVGRLVGLKARLTWNGLRTDVQRRIGMPLTVALMGWGGWNVAARLRAGVGEVGPDLAAEYTAWVAGLMLLAWMALPIVLFPLDENLDPAQFALMPIRRVELAAGLVGAALVSPAVIIPLIVLGTGVALWWPTAGLFAVLSASLLLVTMIVGGQLFTTLLSAVLKTRRGRDLSMLIVAIIGLSAFGGQQVISSTISRAGLTGAVAANPVLGDWWALPGVSAIAVTARAGAGDYVGVASATLAALVAIGVLAAVWQAVLGWMLTTPEASPAPAKARARRGLAEAGGISFAAWSPVAVIARKELRFYLRDPRQRLVWTGAAIFIGITAASIVVGTGATVRFQAQDWLPLIAPVLVLFVGLPIALNQFGWERNAASFLFVFPATSRQLLLGKNLATAIALAVETVALTALLALTSGSTSDLALVPALGGCAIACQLAVGNLVSVIAPLRLPREGTDVFAQATEQGCLAIGAQLVSFGLIGLLLVLPASLAVLTVSFGRPIAPWVTMIASIAWGAVIYAVSLWFSGVILRRRLPEVAGMVQIV